MNSGTAILGSRGILRIAGPDAREWLQGLVTNDVEHLGMQAGPYEARFAALLSPQGKILFDFFVAPDADGLLLDCAADQAQALARRLAMYKLRSRIEIADLGGSLAVAAIWGEGEPPAFAQGRIFADPRTPAMGWRMIAPPSGLEVLGNNGEAAYEAHRIACAIPRGGLDFAWGDAFPHEANMDRLHGIDFRKGCYVGQEVVSRVEHRGLARKRIVGVRLDGPAPEIGAEIHAGEIAIGAMGSSAGEVGSAWTGLAMLRLDRAQEARAAGVALTCGATGIELIEAPAA